MKKLLNIILFLCFGSGLFAQNFITGDILTARDEFYYRDTTLQNKIYNEIVNFADTFTVSGSLPNPLPSLTVGSVSSNTVIDSVGILKNSIGNFNYSYFLHDTGTFFSHFYDLQGSTAIEQTINKNYWNVNAATQYGSGNTQIGFSYNKGFGMVNSNDTVFRVDTSGAIHFADSTIWSTGVTHYPTALSSLLYDPDSLHPVWAPVAQSDTSDVTYQTVTTDKVTTDSIETGGLLDVDGDLEYNFKHCIGSADSVNYSTGTTQNRYYKIGAGITWRENDGFTCAGDSVRILTAGDYKVNCWLNATTSNANDKLRVKLYINNLPLSTSAGRWLLNSGGSGISQTQYYMWYHTFSVNDYISIRITNQTGARASVISDIKLYIEKVPEE